MPAGSVTYGDWEGNQRFPHGMKWLAGKIRELGLRAGLWLVPYRHRGRDWLRDLCTRVAGDWGYDVPPRSISSGGRY